MKGGVGKTTIATNVAYAISRFHDKKVLLIDNDPQFNATQYLIKQQDYIDFIEDNSKCTTLDIYRDRPTYYPSVVRRRNQPIKPIEPNLNNCILTVYESRSKSTRYDLLPSHLNLMELDSPALGTEQRLKNFILKIQDAYDFIFIDCPPTMSVFTLSGYLASDGYLIPIKPDYLSSMGIPLLERAIEKYIKSHGHKIDQIGIVFTMVKLNNHLMRETMSNIRKSGRTCFDGYLRESIQVAKAVGCNQAIFDYSKSRVYGEEIKVIADELFEKIR
jgi:chromosome partitioning protein